MADAGKIMIMPKGAYDTSASYEVLDLVTHNDKAWIAKKNATGIEPSEANSEHWFLLVSNSGLEDVLNGTTPVGDSNKLGGKGANEYLPQNEGIARNFSINSNGTQSYVTYKSNHATIGYLGFNGKDKPVYMPSDASAIHELLHTGNGLPLSGGTVSGNVTIESTAPQFNIQNSSHAIRATVSSAGNAGLYDTTFSKWLLKSDSKGTVTIDGDNKPLHTGNSAKVAIQSSAPSDTTALWVW